jgi:hypothetical protein
MPITLDKQVVTQHCSGCGENFCVVRGSAFANGEPIGLYLIALHGHNPSGRLGHLAVAVLDRSRSEPTPHAMAMDVTTSAENYGFSIVEWSESPWQDEAYLGRMLDRQSVSTSIHKGLFFQIAERVVDDLPEVRDYFS